MTKRARGTLALMVLLTVLPFIAIYYAGVGNINSPVPKHTASAPYKPATRPVQPSSRPARPVTAAVQRYTVRPGDTLTGIAGHFRIQGGWKQLAALNPKIINPNLIYAGESLSL